jgi:uncharacterized protein (DUF2141 family)
MAKGKLGKVLSNAGQAVLAYSVPAGATSAVVTVDLENLETVSGDVVAEIFFSDSSTTPTPQDRVARSVIVNNGGHFELSCKLLGPGEHVLVLVNSSLVAIRISGIEEIAAP